MDNLANELIINFSSTLKSSSIALGLEGIGNIQTRGSFAGYGSSISEIGLIEAQIALRATRRDSSDLDNLIQTPHIVFLGDNLSPEKDNADDDIVGKVSAIVNSNAADWNSVDATENALSKATSMAIESLIEFRNSPDFFEASKVAFGEKITLNELSDAIEQIINVRLTLNLEIVNGDTLLNSGAFAAETNTIYLSEAFLNQNKSNPENIANVLLEEWGHYLDNVLNDTDSDGDEGEIFVGLVKGFSLDIDALKAEDDHASLKINGSNVMVEQAAFGTINLPTRWVIFRSDRGNILAFRRDGRVSALTDIYYSINGVQQLLENRPAPINIFNGQFRIVTPTRNTGTTINPDGTIGFRPGFIQPRLTVSAPRWTRVQ